MTDLPVPRVVAPARGAGWLGDGVALFRRAPFAWIGVLFVGLLVWGLIGQFLPGLGWFLTPVFEAGLLLGCASLARHEGLRVAHLFEGFRSGRLGTLLLMRLWTLLLYVALAGLAFVVLWLPNHEALRRLDDPGALLGFLLSPGTLAAVLGCVAVALLVAMATWFAPALIVFRGVGSIDAMKLSFEACVRNWLPLAVYGLVLVLASLALTVPMVIATVGAVFTAEPDIPSIVAAVILLLVGWVVALPVLIASIYASYVDIFAQT